MAEKNKFNVFDFKHYRDYLKVRLATTGESRGLRSKLAELTHTQPAFISRVLAGELDFTLEHSPVINELLQHTKEEAHFFNLLLMQDRAGNHLLKKYFKEQIDEIIEKRSVFLDRVKASDAVSISDQAIYYSQWYYLAVHVLVGIDQYQTREAIAKRLGLALSTVSKAVEDLTKMGLVEVKGNRIHMGKKRIYLAKNSPWISHLHTHFRNRAIGRIAESEADDLHFSAAMSVSKKVYDEYRKRLLDLMSEFDSKIADSKEEELYAITIDLFRY